MNEDFRIGSWLVQPQRLTLSRGARSVTVKPRSMAVLRALARADGQVLARRALMAQVWGDAEVTDDVLTQSIVELRRALGDDARHPQYIETIKRVGFRLIPPVEAVAQTHERRPVRVVPGTVLVLGLLLTALLGWLLVRPAGPVEPLSVAVLPFADDGGTAAHFADGMAEELIDALTRIPELRVPARTSSFAYRDADLDVIEIGRRLRVAHLLEGSVRRNGNRIRVTAQLVDTGNGYQRWSQRYEYQLGDVFRVQQQIAADVANALAVRLGARQDAATTGDARAYDLYLAGKHHARLGQLERARALFEQAVAVDPGYALAHAGLARLLTFFHENAGGVRQASADFHGDVQRARTAAHTALRLAPAASEVYVAQAAIAAVDGDIGAEQAALERAVRLDPGSVAARMRLSRTLAARGDYAAAMAQLETAAKLDPLNPGLAIQHARLIALFHGYPPAVARLQRLIALDLASPAVWAALMELAADFGRYPDRVRFAMALNAAAPDEGWPKAQLGDAFTELGELELADRWIAAAERAAPIDAFKARARWFAAAGDLEAFARAAAPVGLPEAAGRAPGMTPVQSAAAGLNALAALNNGTPQLAARLVRRLIAQSPTVHRRKPHSLPYAQVVLARALRASGDRSAMRSVLEEARAEIQRAQRAGIVGYPWLTLVSASVHALAGDSARAARAFAEATDQGWRAWQLEQLGVAEPVARETATIRRIEDDLARMRALVREAGLAVPPPRAQALEAALSDGSASLERPAMSNSID